MAKKDKTGEFLTDIKALRERARKHIEDGAVTAGYQADRATVVKLLNEALATELVCILRYKRHYYMATGINADTVAAEFLVHANEEQGHADLIDMIREDLVAERIAIDSYGEMIRYIGDKDITTRRMLEGILAMEEEHADDLSSMLEDMKGKA